MDTHIAIIQTTLPERDQAETFAHALVQARLAACVHIQPGITSVYRWQGACERSDEIVLQVKTTPARADDVCAWLTRHHPYELPEIIVLEHRASPAYAHWVRQEVCAP